MINILGGKHVYGIGNNPLFMLLFMLYTYQIVSSSFDKLY